MKKEAICEHYIADYQLMPTRTQKLFARVDEKSLYEVVKIIDGIPIFFEEHMARLKQSARLSGFVLEVPDDVLRQDIIRLVRENRRSHINVKLVFNGTAKTPRYLVYFIRSEYPGSDAYRTGVSTILFPGERQNPNVKTLKDSFRERVRGALENASAYEALLLDDNGNITEGSRSNLFFLKNDRLYTPPGQNVLLGVTRQKVMAICRANGIPVTERAIHPGDLASLGGLFITGTTVDVLPVSAVGELPMASAEAPLIQQIIREFEQTVARYIADQKTRDRIEA